MSETQERAVKKGATYYRVHTRGICELHIGGSYTICSDRHSEPCPHSAELIQALETADKNKQAALRKADRTQDLYEWHMRQPAHVVTFHGRQDQVLAILPIEREDGCGAFAGIAKSFGCRELSDMLDPEAKPIVTKLSIYHCPKRGRVLAFWANTAGEERVYRSTQYKGKGNAPLLAEFRRNIGTWVSPSCRLLVSCDVQGGDLSEIPDNYIIREQARSARWSCWPCFVCCRNIVPIVMAVSVLLVGGATQWLWSS